MVILHTSCPSYNLDDDNDVVVQLMASSSASHAGPSPRDVDGDDTSSFLRLARQVREAVGG